MADNNGSSNIVAIFAIIVIVLIAGFILYYAFGKHEPDMVPGTTTNVIEAPDTGTTTVPVTTPGTGGSSSSTTTTPSDANLQE